MAKPPTIPASAAGTARPAGTAGALAWAEGLLCGGLVALLPPTALLLGVLAGPAVIAMLLDRQPARPVARSVALFALAASVSPVRTLWAAGHTMAQSLSLATDLQVVGTAWSAAAAGWLLGELAPVAVRAVLEVTSVSLAARLRAERAALAQAWGLPAAGPAQVSGSPPPAR